MILPAGTRLGPYEILMLIGQGGMGQVYRANDTRLNRTVALKILPPDRAHDHSPRQRLIHEAQTVSSLNHPNIVTIYEVGAEDGMDFIAMEYVAGVTLRDKAGRKAMRPLEALHYAAQMADALAAAHRAGIVHRDFKPRNVMITDDGQVKVLDFGVAKLAEIPEEDITGEEVTVTIEGQVAGTAAYMSPEQAEGRKLDSRSDIFSFGSVLYEIFTGRRAFTGSSQVTTMAAIVTQDPPALGPETGIPREVVRIIERCLRKDPARRPQHLEDVRLELEQITLELQGGKTRETVMRASRKSLWLTVSLSVAFAALAGLCLWLWSRQAAPAPVVVAARMTADTGLSAFPALSADGRMLAYASDRGAGNLNIWVQQVRGESPVQLTTDEADDYEPSVSPDGTRVAFRSDRNGGGIYVVPALGGSERLLAAGGHSPQFSPDGKWIAYWTGGLGQAMLRGSGHLHLVDPNTGFTRDIQHDLEAAFVPIWSADGSRLMVVGRKQGSVSPSWWIVPVNGGRTIEARVPAATDSQKLQTPAGQRRVMPIEWKADGSIIFAASLGDGTNIWKIRVSPDGKVEGPAERVTFGNGLELQASQSKAGQLAVASLTSAVSIWTLNVNDQGKASGEPQRLTHDFAFDGSPSVSEDGKTLAFVSSRVGFGVWVKDLVTGHEQSLVSSNSTLLEPKLSASGETLAYWHEPTREGYLIGTRGGTAQRICTSCGPPEGLSRSGKLVMFESIVGVPGVTLADVNAGTQTPILVPDQHPNYVLFEARYAPDEKWVVFHAVTGDPSKRQIFVAPADAKSEKQWIPITDGNASEGGGYWSNDGRVIYFQSERDGFRCVWAARVDPVTRRPEGVPFPVYHFHHARRSLTGIGRVRGTTMAVGGGKLFLALGDLTGNLWMLSPRGSTAE